MSCVNVRDALFEGVEAKPGLVLPDLEDGLAIVHKSGHFVLHLVDLELGTVNQAKHLAYYLFQFADCAVFYIDHESDHLITW